MIESKTIADMLKANVNNKKLTDKEFREFCKTLVKDWEIDKVKINPQSLYKAGTKYGTISPKDLIK